MPYAQISNLDFKDIKTVLKEYMRSQSDFTDYDFEGSVLSNLLDVLAYNTYYTAFNTNMAVNELFIDSATLRDNVVSIARQLGYRPRSSTSPTAYVSLQVDYTNPTSDTEVILKEGTGFVASFNNKIYQFVTPSNVTAQVVNDVATFNNVLLREGTFLTNTFTVNTTNKTQRFVLDNIGIDASTIKVEVSIDGTSVTEPYLLADNILDITGDSKVFFLNEIDDQRYEIIFGDGVIGKKLEDQATVVAKYITTNGPEANGIRTFVFSGVLENPSGISPNAFDTKILSTVTAAGGEETESIQEVKFAAPKTFGTQNRAVVASDYAAIVRNIYPAIGDIIVFGGEEQDPPEYGKVFISVKPRDAAYLTSLTKKNVVNELKKFSVASVEPVLIDPSILYVELNSKIFYDGGKTDKDCDDPVLTSTAFRVTEYPNFDVYLEDNDGKIVLYRLDALTGEKVVLDKEVGMIDYAKGETVMYNLTIIKGSFFDNRISIRVKPASNDIKASREVYLDVDVASSSFIAYKE